MDDTHELDGNYNSNDDERLSERLNQVEHDYDRECERSAQLEREYEDLEERYKVERDRIASFQVCNSVCVFRQCRG